MIKDFLIINCTGKNDSIGLRIDNNFFIQEFQTNIKGNEMLVSNILKFLKKNNVEISRDFSIIVNIGPGSFSSVRISLAVAKGIQVSKGARLYGYKDSLLNEFNSVEIKEHIIQVKDSLNREDLVILEVDERRFNSEMLLDIANLRTYHQTNLIVLVKGHKKIESNQFHDVLMSYGFKNLFGEKLQNIFYDLYEYNIIDYKTKPEWLNSDYWANPELWKK